MCAMPVQVIESQPQNTMLSLIDSLNAAQVQTAMQKIAQFQAVVQRALKPKHDYGTIPGAGSKPVLLKPGAEKILMLMGVTSEYELIEQIQDYERGFFSYTVRCVLSRNGQTITHGLGNCNSMEKKYTSDKQDKYVLANTCLKMAKKRAQVDATLTIASLSEVFTQDLEDMDITSGDTRHSGNTENTGTRNDPPATDKQLGFMAKKAKAKGITEEQLDAFAVAQTGKHVDQLSKKEASDLIGALDTYQPPKQNKSEPQPNDDDPFADSSELVIDDADLPF